MSKAFKFFVLSFFLCFQSAYAAKASRKSWTIKDRLEWNEICKDLLIKESSKRGQTDLKKIYRVCDCVSGELQYHVSAEEYYSLDQNPTSPFLRLMTDSFLLCFRGPT